MDYRNIEELIKVMSNSKLSSLEIKTEGISIKMQKNKNDDENIQGNLENILDKESVEDEVSNFNIEEKVKENSKDIFIKSPIVGTFYSASAPGEEPFAKVGDKVQKGDVFCIIEAMKLMNEIQAEDNYEILEILVQNEEMVEYGQPLYRVKPY